MKQVICVHTAMALVEPLTKLFAELMPGVTRTGKEIRSALKQHLSEYMIPSKVVMMEHLPLNANGKIDRQQLKSTL